VVGVRRRFCLPRRSGRFYERRGVPLSEMETVAPISSQRLGDRVACFCRNRRCLRTDDECAGVGTAGNGAARLGKRSLEASGEEAL